MDKLRQIFLTWAPSSGYLFLLFPKLCMENESLRSRPDTTRELLGDSSGEHIAEARKLSGLAKLARSTRARIGAALLAVTGGAAVAERSEGAIMLQGAIADNVYNNQPQRALALENFSSTGYRIGNADGAADDTVRWFAFEIGDNAIQQDYLVDLWINAPGSSNGSAIVVSPDQVPGQMRSPYFLVVRDIPELTTPLVYGIATKNSQLQGIALNNAQANGKVYAGFGEMTGTPQSLEDAMNMTEYVLHADLPSQIQYQDDYIFYQVDQPTLIPGDYDRDGDVDGGDFLQWQREFGNSVTPGTYEGADGNGDGSVDAADYVAWRDNYGFQSGAGSLAAINSASTSVPEPSSLAYAAGVAAAGLASRRKLRDVMHKSDS